VEFWNGNGWVCLVVGLAYYQGKDVVFRFIIEYSSLFCNGFAENPLQWICNWKCEKHMNDWVN
jgi:hypothetical protein